MACGHLSCPLEQLAIPPVHLLPFAQHLVPSGVESGSQGTHFPFEFLRACGKWGRGS